MAQPADAAASRAVDRSRSLEVQLLPEPLSGLVAQPWQTRRAQNAEVVGSNPTESTKHSAEERQRRPRLAHNQEPAGSSPASAIRPVLPTAGCLAHIETMGVQLPHRAPIIRGCGGPRQTHPVEGRAPKGMEVRLLSAALGTWGDSAPPASDAGRGSVQVRGP